MIKNMITKEDLEARNYKKPDDFMIKSFSVDDITVVAGSSTRLLNKNYAQTGYKILGIVGHNLSNATSGGIYHDHVVITSLSIASDGALEAKLSNQNDANAKVKLTVYVLYVKS